MEGAALNAQEDDADVEVRCHARVSAGRTPSERSLHSCTLQTIEGCRVVYLYAGRSKSGTALDDLHILDLEANYWSSPKPKSESKPAGRYGHSAVSHGEYLYVFGGQSRGQATFAFNPELPKRPSLLGGGKKRGMREADTEVCDELHAYHTPTMEWKDLSFEGESPSPRYKAGSCLVPERQNQAKLLIFGGCDEDEAALNDLYFLDLLSTTWTKPATTGATPSPRFGHSVTLLPAVRKVVVIGGTDGKALDTNNAIDAEFPSHKKASSFCPMSVHIFDLDKVCPHATNSLPQPCLPYRQAIGRPLTCKT